MTNFLLQSPAAVFVHLPKTGGTSIQAAWDGRIEQRAFGHVPKDWQLLPSFTVVRNPIDRFLSAVRMFKFGNKNSNDYYSTPRMPELTITKALNILDDEDIEFDRSVRNMEANLKHHLLPQTHPYNCIQQARKIMRTETLELDFLALAQSMGLEANLPHVRHTSLAHNASKIEPTDAELDRITSVFEEDSKLLGYDTTYKKARSPVAKPQSKPGLWSQWPGFFSDRYIPVNNASESLPESNCDLSIFLNAPVRCQKGSTWPGRERDLIAHFHKLQPEFGRQSRLAHLLACTIVVIRRTKGAGPGMELFHRITSEFGDQLVGGLNLRWLTSVCDTFADFGKNDAQKLLAFNGSLLANTVKLYETEQRMYFPDRPWPPKAAIGNPKELYDGVLPFWTERGDMIKNMFDRLGDLLPTDPVAGVFVAEIKERLTSENTVFNRFKQIEGVPRKPPVKKQVSERLEKIFKRHL